MAMVVFARQGAVAVLTLNRPDKLNALSGAMLDAFQAVTTNVKIATIANRVRENGVRTGELEDYLYDQRQLDGHKLPFLASLRAHSNYLRAAERGLSIFEFAPAATEHDREQWLPLVRWLKSSRSVP